jgi:hypothetical protein
MRVSDQCIFSGIQFGSVNSVADSTGQAFVSGNAFSEKIKGLPEEDKNPEFSSVRWSFNAYGSIFGNVWSWHASSS